MVTTGNGSNSLFYLRPEVAALKRKLDQFVHEECIPAELLYEQHMKQRYGIDRWTIDAIPPCIDQLKLRAKQLGLYNLFIPQHLRHKIPKEVQNHQNNHSNHDDGTTIIPSISLSYREYGIICETLGKCPQIASEVCNCNAPDTGNMEVLLEFGTKEQQEQYLIPLLNGTIRSTFLMTEPDVASSDPTNLQTKLTKIAIRSDTNNNNNNNTVIRYEYILSGKKWWSTGAMDPRCKVALIVAKMDYSHPSLIGTEEYEPNIHSSSSSSSNNNNNKKNTGSHKKHNAHTIVIVPLPHPNICIQRPLHVFGYDDAPHGHAEITFNNVLIKSSYESLIVDEGYGFYISQARLGPGRIHHCMRSIGIAQRCYDMMLQRSTERRTFGKYLYEHGSVQEMIAQSYTDIELARCITLSCANMMDDDGIKLARQQIAMIKVIVPQLTYNVVDRAVQLYGGAGVCNDTILARSLVGLRTLRIADGPDAVHQRTIARMEIQKIQKKKENSNNNDINSQSKRTQSRL